MAGAQVSGRAPGPRALPWLGNAVGLGRDPLAYLSELTRRYGDVVSFRVGLQPALLINQPALIDRIVRDRRFERGVHTRRSLSSLLGPGLLSLEGAPHLRHRRLMAPAFHRERIQGYAQIMLEETQRMLAGWRHGEQRDLRGEMMRLTLAIVARTLFGADTTREAERIERALADVLPALLGGAMLSCLSPLALKLPYGPATRRAIDSLRELVRTLIAQPRHDGGDLLSMLLEAGLDEHELHGELITILLAGHDTTAHTLSWAWYLLSEHPTLQEQLAAEVHEVAGTDALRAEQLPRLQLTDRVVRETMRLYPAAWWSDRMCSAPTELGGFTVPANTMVVFSTYVTQRDARWFAEPARFDPARFLPEPAARIPEGAYLPFGGGVHTCIGNGFAMLEARAILAAIAQRFSVRALAPERVRPRPLVTLGMADPLPVLLRAR